jgi:hypothetical protein
MCQRDQEGACQVRYYSQHADLIGIVEMLFGG